MTHHHWDHPHRNISPRRTGSTLTTTITVVILLVLALLVFNYMATARPTVPTALLAPPPTGLHPVVLVLS